MNLVPKWTQPNLQTLSICRTFPFYFFPVGRVLMIAIPSRKSLKITWGPKLQALRVITLCQAILPRPKRLNGAVLNFLDKTRSQYVPTSRPTRQPCHKAACPLLHLPTLTKKKRRLRRCGGGAWVGVRRWASARTHRDPFGASVFPNDVIRIVRRGGDRRSCKANRISSLPFGLRLCGIIPSDRFINI